MCRSSAIPPASDQFERSDRLEVSRDRRPKLSRQRPGNPQQDGFGGAQGDGWAQSGLLVGSRGSSTRASGGQREDGLLHRERGADAFAWAFREWHEGALGQAFGEAVEPALGPELVGLGEALRVTMRRLDADEREVALGDLAVADRVGRYRLATDRIRRRVQPQCLVDDGLRVGQTGDVGEGWQGTTSSSASSACNVACAAGLRASR